MSDGGGGPTGDNPIQGNANPQPQYPGGQYPGDQYPGQQYPDTQQPGTQYPPPPPQNAGWGQPGQYQPPYQAPGYAYGYQPYAPRPQHPSATTAMVIGIVAIVGVFFCFGALLGPVAWWLGSRAVNEIDASGDYYSGRSEANTGRILGILSTAILVISVVLIGAAIVIDETS